MSDGIIYTGDLPRYVLDHLFDHFTDKSELNVEERSNGDMLQIITCVRKSKISTIGVFSIIFFIYRYLRIPEYADDEIPTAIYVG